MYSCDNCSAHSPIYDSNTPETVTENNGKVVHRHESDCVKFLVNRVINLELSKQLADSTLLTLKLEVEELKRAWEKSRNGRRAAVEATQDKQLERNIRPTCIADTSCKGCESCSPHF